MPVIFTFMLGSFPSGLVIYWTCNNTLSVIQQYVIMRRAGVKVELWDNLAKLFRRLPGGAATQAASPARSDRPRPSPPARAKKARDGAEAGNKARESDA